MLEVGIRTQVSKLLVNEMNKRKVINFYASEEERSEILLQSVRTYLCTNMYIFVLCVNIQKIKIMEGQ